MKYDAVIFDLFGTLIDEVSYPESQAVKHHQKVAELAASLPAPEDEFIRLWSELGDQRSLGVFPDTSAVIAHICCELGLEVADGRIADATRMRLDYFREVLTPRPGTLETISKLREMGYRIGLISDCSWDIPTLWPETPFAQLIEVPVFSCVAKIKKPDPRIYHMACQELGVRPERCLFVGDGSSRELTGATQVGMKAVLIRAPYDDSVGGRREEWDGTRISTLDEVLALVT